MSLYGQQQKVVIETCRGTIRNRHFLFVTPTIIMNKSEKNAILFNFVMCSNPMPFNGSKIVNTYVFLLDSLCFIEYPNSAQVF